MARTVVAMYDEMRHAREAVQDLINSGFSRDQISLVASDARGEYRQHIEGRRGDADEVISDAGKGAGIGAVLGGLAGLVVGLGALTIPGIGPLIAAGPLASALAGAGIGAAAGGLVGALTNLGIPEEQAETFAEGVRQGRVLVTVQTSEERADKAVQILNRHNPLDMDRLSEFRSRSTMERREMGEHTTFPVVEENLEVGKREVEKGRVRVEKTVSETPVEKDVHLREEHVDVERRRVDRPLTDADRDAFREESIEITEHAEQAMARKEARVVEEVDIDKDVTEHTETIRDTVRRTDVNVERTSGSEHIKYDEFEPVLREHFHTTYSHGGSSFEDYAPAYRYGYEIRSNDRYLNKSWNEIENDIRRDFESRYPKMTWKEYRDAVYQGFEVAHRRR